MPLIVGQSDAFWYPVKGSIVGEDGAAVEYEFQAKLKRLSREELYALPSLGDDAAVSSSVLLDWTGVTAPDGTSIPYTPQNRVAVLNICPIAQDVVRTIYEAHGPEGRRKN